MINQYKNKAIADRYPDPSPPPLAWCGWRRKKGSDDAWQQVADSTRPTKGGCYEELMRLSELVGMEPIIWEYAIMPDGEKPGEGKRR